MADAGPSLKRREMRHPRLTWNSSICWIFRWSTRPVRWTRELAVRNIIAEFVSLRERLADEPSRKTLDAIMRLRLDGNRSALLDVVCPGEQEYFPYTAAPDIRSTCEPTRHYVDIGAFDGDTVKKFMLAARHRYASIHAFEPDQRTTSACIAALNGHARLKLHNLASPDDEGYLCVRCARLPGSRVQADGAVPECVMRLDDVLDRMSLLKWMWRATKRGSSAAQRA